MTVNIDSNLIVNPRFNLSAGIIDILKRNGIEKFFEIQCKVIPELQLSENLNVLFPNEFNFLERNYEKSVSEFSLRRKRDLLVSAPTGSGKTLCYVVPIVEALLASKITRTQCLVILPTRELVSQVSSVFGSFTKGTPIHVASLSGAASFGEEQQQLCSVTAVGASTSRPRASVVVCTPGRLVDHLNGTPGFVLDHLRWLVIDEADRLFSQDYDDWLKALYETRRNSHYCLQKLLFSATLTENPAKLFYLDLYNPLKINLGTSEFADASLYALPATLREEMIVQNAPGEKPALVLYLITTLLKSTTGCLLFTHSLEAAQKLALLLKNCLVGAQFTVEYFGSNLSKMQRTKLLRHFASGRVNALVTTDVLTRGIDVDNVDCVINYDIPSDSKTYVHRVGRTARASRPGTAVTLLAPPQVKYFKQLCKKMTRHSSTKVPARAIDWNSEEFKNCKKRISDYISSNQ